MSGKRVIRLGDPTTHGGVVVTASGRSIILGKPVARVGDKVNCPKPGHGVVTIVEGDPTWIDDGVKVALEGHRCGCGCFLISTLPIVARSNQGRRQTAMAEDTDALDRVRSVVEQIRDGDRSNQPNGVGDQAAGDRVTCLGNVDAAEIDGQHVQGGLG